MPYKNVPPFAWSGWRLRLPGGPEGGQYHGFIGPDSNGGWAPPGTHPAPATPPSPWDHAWGGTALREGENRSDYVFRSSAEIRPRPNASGGANVIQALQTKKTPGYAEVPGAYGHSVAGMGFTPIGLPFVAVATPEMCEGPQCPGATNVVAQPPAPSGTPGGTLTSYSVPPISPAPSPTVNAPAGSYLPSQGQAITSPVADTTATDPITTWLTSSTIISGVENLWIAGAAALAAYFLLREHA
jgi:hypothetical protein